MAFCAAQATPVNALAGNAIFAILSIFVAQIGLVGSTLFPDSLH
jgi:hypothetical protein